MGQSSNPNSPQSANALRNTQTAIRVDCRGLVVPGLAASLFIDGQNTRRPSITLASRSTLMHENTKLLFAVMGGVLALAGLAVVVQFADSLRFESWTREDGPIENLQALLYATGGLFFLVVGFRHRRNPWAWLLAVGLLLCAGEEISWGQRIFGFGTPSGLDGVNIQNEANLHNIENIHGNVRTYGFMALGALFVLLPLLERMSRSAGRWRARTMFYRVPVHVVPVAAAAFAFMAIPRYVDADAFGFDEVGELFTALAMGAYGLAHCLHVQRSQIEQALVAVEHRAAADEPVYSGGL
jgi:hypothetical protein